MAKGDDKARYQDAQNNAATQTGNVQSGYNQFANDIASRTPGDRAAADAERQYLTDRYRGVVDNTANRDYLRSITGGPPFTNDNYPGAPSGGSGSGGSGGGGGSAPNDPYGSVRGGFGEFANTGGVNYGAMTEALGGFRDISNTGGFTDQNRKNLAEISQGYSDLYNRPFERGNIDASLGTLRDAQNTGGYNQQNLGKINADIEGLRNFESITPERLAELRSQQSRLTNLDTSNVQRDIDRLRSLDPEFANWAKTGGWTDQDQANYRARAGSTLPSFYSGVSDEIARRNAVSGGYSPGYSASVRAVTRDRARGAADANRAAETDLASQIRSGRQYGLTGQATNAAASGQLSNALLAEQRAGLEGGTRLGQELDLGLAGNRLRGIEGAVDAQSRLEADIANNRIRSADVAGNLELNTGKAESDARLSSLAGRRQTELDPISISNQARLSALTGITDTAQGAERTVQSGRQFGLQGLMGIAQSEEQARQAAAARSSAEAMANQGYDLQRAQLASQNERFSQEMALNGMGGLADLYRSAPGQVGMYNNDYLNSLGGLNNSIGTGVAAQMPAPKQGNGWSSALSSGLGLLSKIPWGGGPPSNSEQSDPNNTSYNNSYADWAQSQNPKPPDQYFPGGQYPGGNLPAPSAPLWNSNGNTGITGGYGTSYGYY